MIEHDGCAGCKHEMESELSSNCTGCKQNAIDKYAFTTNADKVRCMNDKELAELLDEIQTDALYAEGCVCGLHYPDDKETAWIDWLKQKAE